MDGIQGRRILRIAAGVVVAALGIALKYTTGFSSARWGDLFGDLALVSATIILAYELTVRVDLERMLAAVFMQSRLAKDHARIGLFEVSADCTQYDYGPILLESSKVIIVLSDGRTWASVHRDRLRRRFLDPLKQTVFIITHPESSMLKVLARKGSIDESVLRVRILETVHLLEELKQSDTALEILGHFVVTPHAMVIGDDSAVMTPYFLSRGGRTVPALVFKDVGGPCYFRDVVEDIEKLRIDTKSIATGPSNSLEVVPMHRK